jgi:peptide/nickel transport system substrate-binding protein
MDQFGLHEMQKKGILDRFFSKLYSLTASDAFLLKIAVFACFVFGSLFRFINPVLAVTRADRDLTALIYDGLMSLGADGVLVPDIAESVTVSEDGLTYNVLLKNSLKFHDGTPLTAQDVVFTVGRIQDPLLASPLRSNFDGVAIEEIGEFEINFVLPEPYAPFMENLTFGILPQHIWKDAGTDEFPFSQYNSEPIGTGPYRIQKIIRNQSGIPETYILTTNNEYHVQTPKIETLEMHFYPTEEKLVQAFTEGVVGSVVGVNPTTLDDFKINTETHHLERIPLPRTFAVFFNQNKSPALRDLSARQALSVAIDRKALIDTTLKGYGNALYSPVLNGFGVTEEMVATDAEFTGLLQAQEILKDGGWKLNIEKNVWEKEIEKIMTPLTFSIATVNNSSFETTAEFLRSSWEKLGVEVTIKQFEQSDLTQAVIRPRDYEALLFGTQLGRSLDYYSFWHSSQRNDPGLNISLYANITTDSILNEMRRTQQAEGKSDAIKKFAEEINKETPAIFLYAPELLYIFPNNVTGAAFTGVSEPQERFSRVYDWYIKTESVWPAFIQENQ